jgi:hypothetical protein
MAKILYLNTKFLKIMGFHFSVFLAVLDEFLLTSVQVWEKKSNLKKSDKIVDILFRKVKFTVFYHLNKKSSNSVN